MTWPLMAWCAWLFYENRPHKKIRPATRRGERAEMTNQNPREGIK